MLFASITPAAAGGAGTGIVLHDLREPRRIEPLRIEVVPFVDPDSFEENTDYTAEPLVTRCEAKSSAPLSYRYSRIGLPPRPSMGSSCEITAAFAQWPRIEGQQTFKLFEKIPIIGLTNKLLSEKQKASMRGEVPSIITTAYLKNPSLLDKAILETLNLYLIPSGGMSFVCFTGNGFSVGCSSTRQRALIFTSKSEAWRLVPSELYSASKTFNDITTPHYILLASAPIWDAITLNKSLNPVTILCDALTSFDSDASLDVLEKALNNLFAACAQVKHTEMMLIRVTPPIKHPPKPAPPKEPSCCVIS